MSRKNAASTTTNTDTNVQKGETSMTKKATSKATTVNTNTQVANSQKGTTVTTQVTKKWTPEVTLTKEQFGKLSKEDVYKLLEKRISQEKATSILTDLVDQERIAITDPATLPNWTYKRVMISGIDYKGLGAKTPKVVISKEEFGKLNGKKLAEVLRGNISPERAKAIVLVLLENGIVKPTASEVVEWSYNRVMVEGYAPKWTYSTGANGAKKVEVSIAGVVAKSA
jgi:hypothetical protein